MKMLRDTRFTHAAFRISLILKGAFATAEVAASIFAYIVEPRQVVELLKGITETELATDPQDFVANHLLHAAQHLSLGTQHFAAFYLLSHGIVKLWLIIGLWRRKSGYYPTAILIFSLFILYQIYRFILTHSPFLIAITILDGVVIWLTYIEYRQLRTHMR
ncbi:hypothetical protein BZM27_29675 [Paraburkholderia steynii]|uniref:DUF2127 domain-containing protein n=1 Tax=Paraburkholderia steynii TaxID=1245441 RepID=A0A4R0XBD0_9BURK|nr:hypothetical protein BZM27_29675 [Paraburkholderia steynii]